MKHLISAAALFCVLTACCALPALAEEAAPTPTPAPEPAGQTEPRWYPYEITTEEDGAQRLIHKLYRVPAGTAVSELREDGITRLGQPYSLWGVMETKETGPAEQKDVEQTYTLAVHSNIAEEARREVKDSIPYEEDEFTGELALSDLSCAEEMQADGTYAATAVYAGTVTRTGSGVSVFELIYAPVSSGAAEQAAAAISLSEILQLCLIVVGAALFLVLAALLATRRKPRKATAAPAPAKKKPDVYVPSNDIVIGAHPKEDLP